MHIDCHLTWHDHIDYICGKISKNINIIVKLKHYVSKATLISVYYSLIYPYLTYACTLWGNNYNAPLSQIVKLQNKVIRVVNDVPLMESIGSLSTRVFETRTATGSELFSLLTCPHTTTSTLLSILSPL